LILNEPSVDTPVARMPVSEPSGFFEYRVAVLPGENPVPLISMRTPEGSGEDVRDMRGLISWAFEMKGIKRARIGRKTKYIKNFWIPVVATRNRAFAGMTFFEVALNMLKGGFLLFIFPSSNFLNV